MGRNLFIRVSAVTYDETLLPKSWPGLCALVWPDIPAPSPVAGLLPATKGVRELCEQLADIVRFGNPPKEAGKALADVPDKLEDLWRKMDAALGDQDVTRARALTNAVEDALDEAEAALRKDS